MIIDHSELYCQAIKIQEINNWIWIWFDHDCCEQIHKKNILHIISWENKNRKSCLSIQTTHHYKSWSIYKSNIWQRHKIQIKILTDINSIKKDKNKNKYNWTFINEWSDQKIQSDCEIISKMLCKLSTKQLNKTVTHSTVHIQQQHTDIHRNLIISSRIWQKYANKQQNDQIKEKQQASNSTKQENTTDS